MVMGWECGREYKKIGNDRRMKFWKDKWCGDLNLKGALLECFSIAVSKDAWVVEIWEEKREGVW